MDFGAIGAGGGAGGTVVATGAGGAALALESTLDALAAAAAATETTLAAMAADVADLRTQLLASGIVNGWTSTLYTPLPDGGQMVTGATKCGSVFGQNGHGASAYLQIYSVAALADLATAKPLTTTSALVTVGSVGSPTIPTGGIDAPLGLCAVWSTSQTSYVEPTGTNTGFCFVLWN